MTSQKRGKKKTAVNAVKGSTTRQSNPVMAVSNNQATSLLAVTAA
jgi:hypothetical protein